MQRSLLLSAFFVLLASTFTHAQDDAKSKAILDRMIAKSKTYTTFEADFTSRLVSKGDGLDVSQTGNVKSKDGKFRLQLDKNTVINDGKTLYTYNKDNNEVTLNDPSELGQELDPSKLFTMYEKGFKSQFISENTDPSGTVVQVVKLFPIDPSKKPYHTVVFTLDKAKLEPRSLQILYKDGNEVTYTINRFSPNVEFGDALFSFDKGKYPGVEVNDMR